MSKFAFFAGEICGNDKRYNTNLFMREYFPLNPNIAERKRGGIDLQKSSRAGDVAYHRQYLAVRAESNFAVAEIKRVRPVRIVVICRTRIVG